MNTKYIQNIEKIHESTQKGKYFMIMTKIDYKKVMIEVNELVKYIYPDIPTEDLQTSRKKQIIHTNVPTYAQALMTFHELNTVLERSSNKRLKLQFYDASNSSKRDSTPDLSINSHNQNNYKSLSFVKEGDPTPPSRTNCNIQNMYGIRLHISNQSTPLQQHSRRDTG